METKFNDIQNSIDKTKYILQNNMGKIIERGENIDDLIIRTDILKDETIPFARNSKQLKTKMWFENIKIKIYIALIILIIFGISIAIICVELKKK